MLDINYAEHIALYDTENLYSVLKDFPRQMKTGFDLGNSANFLSVDEARIGQLVICGMGGSAIGGDILRSFASGTIKVPVIVNRGYQLPAFVGDRSLVVVMSYSGNTEESLSAYEDARFREAQVVAITSGGQLLERAERDNVPAVIVPGGLAPRAALGFLFAPLLMTAARLDLLDIRQSDLQTLLSDLATMSDRYADHASAENLAISIARKLHGKLPVLYSAQDGLEAVLTRWRCQIEENAKMLAYSNVFPEMNHNEIVGWQQNPDLLKRIVAVVLHDKEDLPRIR